MRLFPAVLLLVPAIASADDRRCLGVTFTPSPDLQIVAWIEQGTPGASTYLDTIYITQQTGTFGLGNRPGRFDFNTGPNWPYGRRITTFPVWSHRNQQQFPVVMFQNDFLPDNVTPFEDPDHCFMVTGAEYNGCGENNLSHGFDQSSREQHYCRPLLEHELGWDTATCATQPFSDKGRFSLTKTTGYPPRADLTRLTPDSPSVSMYKQMNPYDAVSQPTPIGGMSATAPWPVPTTLPDGNYVLFVEVAKERDFNNTYTAAAYPSPPGLNYGDYGVPYRGQPSVIYTVPFTIAANSTTASTMTYAGHGDPDGLVGDIIVDSTIETGVPGSGASRLQLVSDNTTMYRLRVDVTPNVGASLPGTPGDFQPVTIGGSTATLSFVAPGVGATHARVSGYDIRIRAGDEMTAANFIDSTPVTAHVTPDDAGAIQDLDLTGLLPETDYWVGIRAYDGCKNNGDIAIIKITTAARTSGAVDACFVATAAYGTVMANDVELLRHFRDSMLQKTVLGELSTEAYYTFGPLVAGVVGESDLLRASARDVLAPIIARVRALAF